MQNGEPEVGLSGKGLVPSASDARARQSLCAVKTPRPGSQKANASGLKCANHPWRPAYAMCEYCKRPFCYADLASENGCHYCFEDANVAKHAGRSAMHGGAAMNFVGALLISNAIIIGVMVYPHLLFAASSIGATGAAALLPDLSAGWLVFYINLSLIAMGLSAGAWIIMSRPGSGHTLCKLMMLATIAALAYQYVISMSAYLLFMLAVEVFTMALLAYTGMTLSLARYDAGMFGTAASRSSYQ